ncbi:MAG: hypothetical protein COA45_12435 [Zetaproteobacteria bacterium]|nr:MAG: hypothetical protein COA45_12435 [Zetaproteobacteria bacterium]
MKKYSKIKGRSKGQFIMLRHDIVKSPAWRSLSTNARCVWTEIMLRYNGDNNGEIPLSCREAAELCNISKGSAKRAYDDLLDRGFIKVGWYSSFTYKYKKSRRWIITHERFQDKTPTNEWRKWKP